LGGWEAVDLPVAGRFLFVPLLTLRSILERYASQKAKSTKPRKVSGKLRKNQEVVVTKVRKRRAISFCRPSIFGAGDTDQDSEGDVAPL